MDDGKKALLKKLDDAYQTGWEFRENSAEPGGVLAEAVLALFEWNEKQYGQIWEKHKREFLQLAPELKDETTRLEGMAAVLASDGRDGYVLPDRTVFTAVTENSEILHFETQERKELSAAVLQKAYYETGGSVYRVYDREEQEDLSFSLFQEEGEKVESLKLHWRFRNLCNALERVDWEGVFTGIGDITEIYRLCANRDRARITVTDGEAVYELAALFDGDEAVPAGEGDGRWENSTGQFRLCGSTPDFVRNLQDTDYDICLEVLDPHEGRRLSGQLPGLGLNLTEKSGTWKPQLYLTDLLQTVDGEVLPFTTEPDSSSCCYIACDNAFARMDGEITIHFQENYRVEELLPEDKPEEYKKKMKKYAWMLPGEKVLDWRCEETLWEYYNGAGWRPLPGSSDWNTGCVKESREVRYSFQRPEDMQACVMEGEEHYYLRLRLVSVQNAYTQYYHKYIPVLREVAFTCPPVRYGAGDGQMKVSGLEEGLPDRMYFAFSHVLPSQIYIELKNENSERVYKGEWPAGRERGGVWQELFGYYGYWLTVRADMLSFKINKGGSEDGEKLILSGLWCNPVRVQQVFMEGEDSDSSLEEVTEGMLLSPGAGGDGLAGEVLKNFYLSGKSSAPPDPVRAAEHYFTGQDRVVSARDLEKLLKERYTWIEGVTCTVEDNGRLSLALWGNVLSSRQESWQQEIQGWLEGCLEEKGCWWLQECEVVVKTE